MAKTGVRKAGMLIVAAAAVISLVHPRNASAHCDTLDGPVVQDARKAIQAKDVTPALKWVQPNDEKAVRAAFGKVVSKKATEQAQNEFFGTLVKIHRAGEGAPYTGLKPAGAVEPAVAEADKALTSGSADQLIRLITDDVAAGIRKRHERAAAAFRHKDDSVAKGREFVAAYVDYTHYVERLHLEATGKGAHAGETHHEKQEGHMKKGSPSKP